jgi:hypothetical protein
LLFQARPKASRTHLRTTSASPIPTCDQRGAISAKRVLQAQHYRRTQIGDLGFSRLPPMPAQRNTARDVLNTYQVWLRYELFRGRLSDAEFQASGLHPVWMTRS